MPLGLSLVLAEQEMIGRWGQRHNTLSSGLDEPMTSNIDSKFQASVTLLQILSVSSVLTVLKGSVGLYLPEAAKTNQPTALFSDWPFTFLISNHFGLHP